MVNTFSRPKSARNSYVSKSLSFQDKGIYGRPSLELDTTTDIKEVAALGLFTSNSPSGYLFKFGKNTGMTTEEARQII